MTHNQPANYATNQPANYRAIHLADHLPVEPLVEVTRGPCVESIHFGAVAVVDAHGELVAHVGDPEWVTFLRSSAKPFQLLPLVESGAADHFGFTDRELAVMAASHSGEPRHVETVRGILTKIGLTEDALLCGTHEPLSPASQRVLREAGRAPTPIYNNCSGKHAGMLAQTVYHGWSARDYLDPRHPVQERIRRTLAEMSDTASDEIAIGVDGCSVPCFALPLRACALAFARLADPSGLPAPRRYAVERVVTAMTAHPEMVAGEDRLDTDLMRAAQGRIISKGGAEGYHGMAIRSTGLGIAMKIVDGNGQRGTGPAAIEVLRQLGALDDDALAALGQYRGPITTNHRGIETGEVKAVLKLFDVTHVL